MKMYPFSMAKNAHSIEFYWNRMRNILSDMECGEVPMDHARYDEIADRLEDPVFESLLDKVYSACGCPVVYLTGPEIGMAKKIVAWASEERAASCIKRGRYDLVKYC